MAIAVGANCGVGASDLLVSISAMTKASPDLIVIAKANCGVPKIKGDEVVYTGTPELMARYAQLARDAGARIIGGCCGTTSGHLAAMHAALVDYEPAAAPDLERIVEGVGPLTNPVNVDAGEGKRGRRRSGRRG
ncbi:MAG: homocysteine S-methyltransferase family protein [Pseudomonadota bacterium]